MACTLTKGRLEPCKDKVGGIANIYFANFGDLTAVTYSATVGEEDSIASIGTAVSAYKYEVRGASSFTQNIQSSRDNGTTAFEQVLELTLKRLSAKDHKEIKLLSYGRPHVVIETQNGDFFLAGLKNGMEVTGGTIVTGKSMNDLSGYTLTLTGQEIVPANFLSPALPTGNTMLDVGFSVVSGV